MLRAAIEPSLLTWARERAGLTLAHLTPRFPRLAEWETGRVQPTVKQLESFATATFVPVGYLFLKVPPIEPMPIPDFRTIAGQAIAAPSPHLLDTIYLCQSRQAWYRDYAVSNGEPRRTFVGSRARTDAVETVASEMRELLGMDLDARRDCPTWTDALRQFIAMADDAGVLVMVSGVVQNNTHRPLDPGEFRGFALADDLAPVVFVNGADTKAAQMFTLAHELAHLWLGESAVSDAGPADRPRQDTERWCNQVAAEFLVPLDVLRNELHGREPLADQVSRLARRFKVSALVVLRRLRDADVLTHARFEDEYERELTRLLALPGGSGGNFYLSEAARVSKRLARALVVSTLEGTTLYRDAFRMLGIRKTETLDEFGRSLGVVR